MKRDSKKVTWRIKQDLHQGVWEGLFFGETEQSTTHCRIQVPKLVSG